MSSRHTVPDAAGEIFTGFPALGVGLRETLGLLRQQSTDLILCRLASITAVSSCSGVIRRENPAQHLLIVSTHSPCLGMKPQQGRKAVVAGDQPVEIILRNHGERLRSHLP